MKRTIQISILILLLSSCKTALTSMHFGSLDEYTGGFKDYSLDLDSNGKLLLTVIVFLPDTINEKGTEWVSNSKIFTGKWWIKNKHIRLTINEPKDTNDLIFNNPDYDFLKKKPTIQFSNTQDTAYIYGIPCILIKK